MNITLPIEVKTIISNLESEGFEAFAVGGCIRDALLGREPKDWDITTNALPEDIKRIFPVTIDTGIAHGTVTVRLHKQSFEVTTYRADGEYLDSRHPSEVTFVRDLKEDLRRRDFTINALAYNESRGLVDEFGGLLDLQNGIIRCVEDPLCRFTEDALRMMRAVRFVAQLGFSLEKETASACKKLAANLANISAERIADELIKLICSDRPGTMILMYELGLTAVFFPEWDAMMETEQNTVHHRASVGLHTTYVMENVPPVKPLRLAALLHDIAKPVCKKTSPDGQDHFAGHPGVGVDMSVKVLRRLKMDNDTIHYVSRLVRFHDERPPIEKRTVRRAINRMGEDLIEDFLCLRRADVLGQSDYRREEKLQNIEDFREMYREILADRECTSLKDLAVKGADVIALGIPAGPKVGEVLHKTLEHVLTHPSSNNKESLLAFIRAACLSFVLVFALVLGGCAMGGNTGNFTPEPDISIEEESEIEDEVFVTQGRLYVVLSLDTSTELLMLKDIYSGRELLYGYNLSSEFFDKNGVPIGVTGFSPGRIVEIDSADRLGLIEKAHVSDQVWEYNDVSNFSIDTDRGVLSIGNSNYRLTAGAIVFSGNTRVDISSIGENDILRLTGQDKDIWTINITTGHGNINLINTQAFDGSLICIGNIFTLVNGDMSIEVPEGTYTVTVANKGYGGTAQVNVERGGIVTLDLDTMKGEQKFCNLTFKIQVEGAQITLDGNPVQRDVEIPVEYGRHVVSVKAAGYEAWTKYLYVNSPQATIVLDMAEEGSSKGNKGNSSESSSGNSSGNNSGNNQGTNNNNNTNSSGSSGDSNNSSSDQDEKNKVELEYLTTIRDMITSIAEGL